MVDDHALADKLENAYRADRKILALEVEERVTILAALEDPPSGLAELRASCSRPGARRRD